jgi:truncated hemoglobin YjbI
MVMMLSREQRQAHFHWAETNKQQPCFCNPVIHLDVIKLNASPETIGSIFGIKKVDTISIHEKDTGKVVPLSTITTTPTWDVEPEKDYEVRVSYDENDPMVVPINQIFPLFPGNNNDEKSDRIQKLSENFYGKLWDDPDTPQGLRDLFFSRTSSYKIQAFRQYDWFHETFGGPSMMDNYEREKHLLPKVMAKHTSSRMSREYAVAWLQIMNKALAEEFPEEEKLKSALALYW